MSDNPDVRAVVAGVSSGSGAAFPPVPYHAVDAATKAFVLSFTEAPRAESNRGPA